MPNLNQYNAEIIPLLKEWKEAKEKDGFIPTVGLLIEELEDNIKKITHD